MIMNILLPDSGHVALFGQSMDESLKKRIGYLPEERGLYVKMKVIDMLVFLGKLHQMPPKEALASSDRWLRELELIEWRDKKIEELSKGMQQKIQFIGTIMHNPDLIILDEPFSGLDPINTQLIKDILMNLRGENKSIMFSTHQLESAERLCDDILLINKGQKVLDGDIGDVKKRYGREAIQIEYEGNAEIIKNQSLVEKSDDYGNYIELILKKEADPNQLLKQLVDNIKIRRFECSTSSLKDIFIETVGSDQDV
jgi:ABC-2 type transport system ATP-binding protein